jgi:transglutaminase-like putative cysteine protease
MKNFSLWLAASILTAFGALALSTQSPVSLVLPVLYVAPLLISRRMDRDSANIWGLRLLVYALFILLGRASPVPYYAYDARAFVTTGLIIGGEILIQSFRNPPKGYRFDPILIFLSGVVFLIACNTMLSHIWVLAPIYVFFTLLALNDLRPKTKAAPMSLLAKRLTLIAGVTAMGAFTHMEIWAYRNHIMAAGARLLSRASGAQAGGTEMSDSPQLSSSFNVGSSTARLLKIKGSLNSSHLRGAAFDEYYSGMWGPKLSERSVEPALPKDTLEEDPKDFTKQRTDTDATVTILIPSGGLVFAPLNSYALVPESSGSFDWDQFSGPVKTEDEPPINYGIIDAKQVVDGIPTTQGPLCVPPTPAQRRKLLRIPQSIDPKVVALAQEVTIEANSIPEKAAMVTEYLFKTNKYSLEFQVGTQDPVSDFVLNKKAAHCQYFASAAVMMLRANGIPARYVTGFYAHETAADGTTIVRGRDAHAWTEAYIDGVGWIALDATPPIGRADPNASPLPWYQKALEWVQDTFTNVRTWIANLTSLQIAGLIGLALIIWGAERLRQNWKKRRNRPELPKVPIELEPLAKDFERALLKHGITLRSDQTWNDLVPIEWENARRWIENYNRLRFESEERSQSEILALKDELQQLKKETPPTVMPQNGSEN